MIRILSISLAIVFSTSIALGVPPQEGAQAQPAAPMTRRHVPDPSRETAHLARQLKLTPDQSAKLQPILAERDRRLTDLRSNMSLSRKDAHHQMRAVHEDTLQQLSSVLTPQQMKQMKAMRRRRGRSHEQPAAGI